MSLCYHATTAEVDLGTLAYNYHQLRQFASPSVKFLAVVKADAYGHGAIPVSKKLEELGADFLLVDDLKARRLAKRLGITITGPLFSF